MKTIIGVAIAIIAVVAPAVRTPLAAGAASPPCSASAGVTVIVDFTHFSGGRIERGCAPGHPADALAAVRAAGFATAGTAQYGDAFVCRIDGLPTPKVDACAVTPSATAYWAFWHARPADAKWTYSSVGVLDLVPAPGSILAFAFGAHAQPGIAPSAALPPATTTTAAPPTTLAPPVTAATLPTAVASTTTNPPPATMAPTTSAAPVSTSTTVTPTPTPAATSTTRPSVVERAAAPPHRPGSGSPAAAIATVVIVALLAIGAFLFTRARRRRLA